jgi:ABC-type oligopeptide transport system ATPase subunit
MSITDIRTPLVEVVNLKKHFKLRGGGKLHAVDGINLKIYPQETVGVVGESGCGKSTLGRSIIRLIEPTSGQILYNGRNLMELGGRKMRELRKELQVIFQPRPPQVSHRSHRRVHVYPPPVQDPGRDLQSGQHPHGPGGPG